MDTTTTVLLVGGLAVGGYLFLRSRNADAAPGAGGGRASGGGGGGGGGAAAATGPAAGKRAVGQQIAAQGAAPDARKRLPLQTGPRNRSDRFGEPGQPGGPRVSSSRPATGGRTTTATVAQIPKLGTPPATKPQSQSYRDTTVKPKVPPGPKSTSQMSAAERKAAGDKAMATRQAGYAIDGPAIAKAALERQANTGAGRF